MTVDVEALLAESGGPSRSCMTCRWLDSREDEGEIARWQTALDQPKTFPGAQVSRAMAKVKTDIPAPTARSIQNHRLGHTKNR